MIPSPRGLGAGTNTAALILLQVADIDWRTALDRQPRHALANRNDTRCRQHRLGDTCRMRAQVEQAIRSQRVNCPKFGMKMSQDEC